MSYNKNFHLDTTDIYLIETALQRELSALSQSTIKDADPIKTNRIREIQQLLGRLHNQKNGSGLKMGRIFLVDNQYALLYIESVSKGYSHGNSSKKSCD